MSRNSAYSALPPAPFDAAPGLAFTHAIDLARRDLADHADEFGPLRDWLAHVEAGRIGVPAPLPPEGARGELRFASLERILGTRRGG